MISEMAWMKAFKTEVMYYMRQQNLSQRDLADKAGLSYSAVNQYLQEKRIPTLQAALRISYALKVDISELVDFGQIIG